VELDAGAEVGGDAWSSRRHGARRCESGVGNSSARRRHTKLLPAHLLAGTFVVEVRQLGGVAMAGGWCGVGRRRKRGRVG
jgi:hypothetical protein